MITLLDKGSAKKGYEFVYYGKAEECKDCDLANVCHGNLERGRKYHIVMVREFTHNCRLFGEVVVSEVKESKILAAIDVKKAFEGSSIVYTPINCEKVFCKNFRYCKPEGLVERDRCVVEGIKERAECSQGNALVIAAVRRL